MHVLCSDDYWLCTFDTSKPLVEAQKGYLNIITPTAYLHQKHKIINYVHTIYVHIIRSYTHKPLEATQQADN